ncbi:hypothetical protein E4U21_005554 [Claviceps maximensis]|nr:hypothetical protein E4U21_005554 [Claviceps maximensis]
MARKGKHDPSLVGLDGQVRDGVGDMYEDERLHRNTGRRESYTSKTKAEKSRTKTDGAGPVNLS